MPEHRRAQHNAPFCSLIRLLVLLVACSGEPFTAAGSGGADAAGGNTGGLAGSSTELPAAARAGASSGSGDSAASGSGGVVDANHGAELGGALGGAGERAAGGAAGNSSGPISTCPRGSGTEYQLKFHAENQADIEQDLHPFFEVVSLNGKSVALSRLKIRYYYTKEADGSERGSCFWVTGDRCSLVKFVFSDLVPPTPTANRVMEVSFDASSAMLGVTPLEVRTGFTVNHANLEQGNDYSFLSDPRASGTAEALSYNTWDRVTLYVDDELVWGNEPCSAQ